MVGIDKPAAHADEGECTAQHHGKGETRDPVLENQEKPWLEDHPRTKNHVNP